MKLPPRSARVACTATALFAAACADPAGPRVDAADVEDRPAFERAAAAGDAGQPIPDEYIVVFNGDVADAPGLAQRLAASQGAEIRYTYQHALRGFAARMSAQAAGALARNPNVAYVEQDQEMYASTEQAGATWGIDRIDQRSLPLSTTYAYTATGSGVTAYIIDTGIRFSHGEFDGRATSGFDAVDGGAADDCNGHGTHVAGTVGGETYGVAKGVSLVAVRVLSCSGSGSTSGVIAGINWVTEHHTTGAAVANMSLGGGASTALDDAVRNSIADGVSYAIAAGNGNIIGIAQDACKYSPARVAEAMTIGASDRTDRKASFSNYGACVDFFAPGVSITSAWYRSDADVNTISGTSMATPHVAGVAALYLQSNGGATPAQVRDALFAGTTKGAVSSAKTTNNHLLFSGY
ncbi:S8 family peptidase [Roseisolibacter agri]|uniref:Serine protease n=1 Tax=Roseisolibacter agri TaxID=2014610 RepID=A0AA37PZP3_9BACT|nr:S8 family peptidase [Roseisolibacter agri]GLC23679.1 serine protease [Roseisolibacter agri]